MFKPITLTFKGQDYEVPANKVLGLIAEIEEHVNVVQLNDPTSLKYSSLARAYAAAIWYAGGRADPDEVYAMLFEHGGATSVRNVIADLITLMVPPSVTESAAEGTEEGKAESPES
jgi:hypothetical protein